MTATGGDVMMTQPSMILAPKRQERRNAIGDGSGNYNNAEAAVADLAEAMAGLRVPDKTGKIKSSSSGSQFIGTSGGSAVNQSKQQQQQQQPVVAKYEDDPRRRDAEDSSLSYLRSFKRILKDGRELKFFHIPKTAGTAIEYAAGATKREDLAWGSCLFRHKPKRSICHYPSNADGSGAGIEWPLHIGYWHIPRSYFPVAQTDPYQNAELFVVIRSIYERMISEFYYICTLKILEWRPNQCDRSRLFDDQYMNEWIQHKLKAISNEPSTSPLRYLTDNGHFTSQHEFVVGPNQVRMIDHVLRLGGGSNVENDNLNAQFAKLIKAYDLDKVGVQLKKLNSLGNEDEDKPKRDGANVVENHRQQPPEQQSRLGVEHLNDETLKWIHKSYYPNDFDLGGYTKTVTAMT